MSKRKSDNLEFVPSLTPSKDEVVTRRQGRAKQSEREKQSERVRQSERVGSASGQDVVRTQSAPVLAQESEGASVFVVMGVVVGFVLLFLGVGYLYQQVQVLEGGLQSARKAAAQEVEVLNGRLSQTGEIISKEGGDVEAKLALHESEIRKLWDVANKRNKKAIDDNKRRLQSAVKKVEGASKQNAAALSSLKAELELVSVRQVEADKGVARVLARAAQIELLQSSLEDRLVAEENVVKALRKEMKVLAGADKGMSSAELNALQESLAQSAEQLAQRVAANELAINAIDSHRAQLNRSIERIQQENERVYRLVDSTLKTPPQ